MKAAVYQKFGPPEVLRIEDIEKPALQDFECERVLIKVHAASVNPFDYLYRSGYLLTRLSNGWLKPKNQVLGIDVAGTVEAIGSDVTRFKVGDRVFGGCLGSHAEYVRTHQNALSLIPENVTFQEASAVPTAAQTALQALRNVAQIEKGQKVLVYGASGGIGHFSVQLAHYFGTEVTAVCSGSNLGWVAELGADHTLDYTREDFAATGETYDIILDSVGKRTFFNSRQALKETGTYITEHILYPKYHVLQFLWGSLTGDKRAKNHLTRTNAEDLDFLAGLMAEGALKPVIDAIYPLDQIVKAHRHVENRHTKGKVLVAVLP